MPPENFGELRKKNGSAGKDIKTAVKAAFNPR
jgi:hypothetical protein